MGYSGEVAAMSVLQCFILGQLSPLSTVSSTQLFINRWRGSTGAQSLTDHHHGQTKDDAVRRTFCSDGIGCGRMTGRAIALVSRHKWTARVLYRLVAA